MKKLIILACSLITTFSATLKWDKSSETNVVGYYYYTSNPVGTAFGKSGMVPNTNAEPSVVLTNIAAGAEAEYYVTAVNNEGLESEPSEKVRWHNISILTNEIRVISFNPGVYSKTTDNWNNFVVTWTPINKTVYGFTNYVLVAASANLTNYIQTPNNTHSFPVLARGEWRFSVYASNKFGVSPIESALLVYGKFPQLVTGPTVNR
jgi:hypothetical protein